MSTVQRYTLSYEPYENWDPEPDFADTADRVVVLAADYDARVQALTAELTETQRLDALIVQGLSARVQALETALKKYGRHINGCRIPEGWDRDVCTCGLRTALAAPASKGAPT